jgi:hypothetical protein
VADQNNAAMIADFQGVLASIQLDAAAAASIEQKLALKINLSVSTICSKYPVFSLRLASTPVTAKRTMARNKNAFGAIHDLSRFRATQFAK